MFHKFKLFPKYLFNYIYLLHFYRIIKTKTTSQQWEQVNVSHFSKTSWFWTFKLRGKRKVPGKEKCAKETRVPMDIPSDVIDMSSLFTSENPFHAQIAQKVSVIAQNTTEYMYFILILKYLH